MCQAEQKHFYEFPHFILIGALWGWVLLLSPFYRYGIGHWKIEQLGLRSQGRARGKTQSQIHVTRACVCTTLGSSTHFVGGVMGSTWVVPPGIRHCGGSGSLLPALAYRVRGASRRGWHPCRCEILWGRPFGGSPSQDFPLEIPPAERDSLPLPQKYLARWWLTATGPTIILCLWMSRETVSIPFHLLSKNFPWDFLSAPSQLLSVHG